jgi:hypothetical protein
MIGRMMLAAASYPRFYFTYPYLNCSHQAKQIDRENRASRGKRTNIYMYVENERETERETERQSERQSERQAERQTDR